MRVLKAFPGGVHPKDQKEYTKEKATRQAKVPSKVVIPMIQHTGAPCQPIVKVGDSVKKGELIGKVDQFITSPVHASISGVVKAITETPHPVVGKAVSITIESDGLDEWAESLGAKRDAETLTKDELLDIIKMSGIVGLGGAAFPAHVKLKPPKRIDTVIINGAECEPYLTCDDRLMIERPKEILKGLLLILKAVDADKAVIAIESNKPKAIDAVSAALNESKTQDFVNKEIALKVLPVRYPQGSEKQLIEAVLKRKVPPKGLPLNVGCVVHNAGTALAIYEAVYERKPLIERSVTLSGDCIKEPLNLKVRIGVSVRELLEECGGAVKEISKLISGGPMMGIAQSTLDIPVIKGASGFLFLSAEKARIFEESACIRCGRCVNVCPMNLLPLVFAKFAKKERWDDFNAYNIEDCMECGSCAYICPSRIPLVQYIKTGKRELFLKRKK